MLISPADRSSTRTKILLGLLLLDTAVTQATLVKQALSPKLENTSDSRWYVPTALSILHDGNIDISEIADNPKQFYGLLRLDRLGTVNYFPVGTSIVALPFAFVGTMVGASELEIAASAANTIAALSAVVLFMLANNLGGGISKSLFIALLFALGTSQLSIHAGGLWSHRGCSMGTLDFTQLFQNASSCSFKFYCDH